MAPISRGSIVEILLPITGSELKHGAHRCVVVQTDRLNSKPTYTLTVVVPITSRPPSYASDVPIDQSTPGLDHDSTVDCAQIIILEKADVKKVYGPTDQTTMKLINQAIFEVLGLLD